MSMNSKSHAVSHLVCPIAKTAEMLSDTWTILIIKELMVSQRRFCELEKELSGISTRTLTLKLKKLVTEKIVEKNDIIYSLTGKGKKLKMVFDAMRAYGKCL